MKKITYLIIALFVSQFSLLGQAPGADENSLLWEISGKGLETPSFLFGTIHMINKEDFILTDATKKAFAASEAVTFEIDMEDMMDIGSQFALLSKAFMDNDLTLKDLYTEEEYGVVKAHFNKIGLPLMFMERIKPMFLTVLASEDIASGGGLEGGDVVSYEIELMKMAQSKEMEIGGLETAEYQMSMFDSIPYKDQAQMLLESIQSTDSGDDQFDEMVQLYKNQDLIGMEAMIKGEENGLGGYEELLLVNRNKNWIPVMAGQMKENATFFAVGAGHLGGEFGVVALLRAEGYDVKAIY